MNKVPPLRCDALSTHHNRWGYRGVEQVKPGRFRATLGNHAWRSGYFDTAREAAKAYDKEARRRYGKLGYFNFPRKGERRVKRADAAVGGHGHSRELHTYIRPDGRGQCRLCVALAHARSAARRKARA